MRLFLLYSIDILPDQAARRFILTDINGETITNCTSFVVEGAALTDDVLMYGLSPKSIDVTYQRVQCIPPRLLKSKGSPGSYFSYRFRTNIRRKALDFSQSHGHTTVNYEIRLQFQANSVNGVVEQLKKSFRPDEVSTYSIKRKTENSKSINV